MSITKKSKYHFYNKDKNKQAHSQIVVHNEHLKIINKIKKYKNLKIQKELNSNSMTDQKIDMNITKIGKYKKIKKIKK